MSRKFFISDMHFGHEKIIPYENRPFKDADEMDKTIIENWNKTVKKNDIVFILGDISLHSADKTKKIIQSLKGRKHLIMGNHDSRTVKFYKECGIEFVSKWSIIVEDWFVLSHIPIYLTEDTPYVNIHGHIHSKCMIGNYFNVSVERIGYKPILFEDIKKGFKV